VIELNADIGEGYDDAGLMPYLARVSIACGGHAGDVASMTAALRLAAEFGVMVGAHPSFPDRPNFGRLAMVASKEAVSAWITQQIEVLSEQAACLGLRLVHVKPHGALYNVAAFDMGVAEAIVNAVVKVDPSMLLVGLSGRVISSKPWSISGWMTWSLNLVRLLRSSSAINSPIPLSCARLRRISTWSRLGPDWAPDRAPTSA